MAEIRRSLTSWGNGSLSHYLQGFSTVPGGGKINSAGTKIKVDKGGSIDQILNSITFPTKKHTPGNGNALRFANYERNPPQKSLLVQV